MSEDRTSSIEKAMTLGYGYAEKHRQARPSCAAGSATRLPSGELVADRSQGVQLATIQEIARYWETDYDWRKAEVKLNALPQFTTPSAGPAFTNVPQAPSPIRRRVHPG